MKSEITERVDDLVAESSPYRQRTAVDQRAGRGSGESTRMAVGTANRIEQRRAGCNVGVDRTVRSILGADASRRGFGRSHEGREQGDVYVSGILRIGDRVESRTEPDEETIGSILSREERAGYAHLVEVGVG